MQLAATAFFLALESAGNNNAVKIPMIAMTTNSSIRVNPAYLVEDWYWFTEFYIVVLPNFFQAKEALNNASPTKATGEK